MFPKPIVGITIVVRTLALKPDLQFSSFMSKHQRQVSIFFIFVRIENIPCKFLNQKYNNLVLFFLTDFPQCNSAGLFQCQDNKHICIANRYVCDGVKDCNDGSDETPEQCGPGDWCSGRIKCGNEQRCMDPRFCCDPQDDINCAYVMECCKVYIDLKRNLHRQYGIEKSGQNTNNTKHHLFVIVGKKHDKHITYF